MPLFRNGMITPIIHSHEVLLEYGGPLIQYDWCPHLKGASGDEQTDSGRTPHEDEGRIGMILLQGKECQRLPINHQEPGQGPRTAPTYPTASEGADPANTLISDFQPPEL